MNLKNPLGRECFGRITYNKGQVDTQPDALAETWCQVLRGAESADVGGEVSQQSRAAVLVHEALKAESQGDAEQRRALLRAALDEDADYAPARWHLGYVKVDDRWLSAEEVALERQADPNLMEYFAQRDARASSDVPVHCG